jgi:leucyl aminopeptidase
MTWGDPSHPTVVLVGKGVTFDTGGLDIKPAQFMRQMKKAQRASPPPRGVARALSRARHRARAPGRIWAARRSSSAWRT